VCSAGLGAVNEWPGWYYLATHLYTPKLYASVTDVGREDTRRNKEKKGTITGKKEERHHGGGVQPTNNEDNQHVALEGKDRPLRERKKEKKRRSGQTCDFGRTIKRFG